MVQQINVEVTKWIYEVTHYYYANINNSYPVADQNVGHSGAVNDETVTNKKRALSNIIMVSKVS